MDFGGAPRLNGRFGRIEKGTGTPPEMAPQRSCGLRFKTARDGLCLDSCAGGLWIPGSPKMQRRELASIFRALPF